MIRYPLTFLAESSSTPGSASNWSSSAASLDPITCSIPKEFMGPGNGYSPEDFLLMAVINCFTATFKVFAEKTKLEFKNITVNGSLVISRLESGQVGVCSIKVNVNLLGTSDHEKAKLLLEETKKNCLMANALKVAVEFNCQIA